MNGGRPAAEMYVHAGDVYPTSLIVLYPVVKGIAPDRAYRYTVYDGQSQTIAEVSQQAIGYESSAFFEGNAFKIETSLHGQSATT